MVFIDLKDAELISGYAVCENAGKEIINISKGPSSLLFIMNYLL
jgi:hypothetical protein